MLDHCVMLLALTMVYGGWASLALSQASHWNAVAANRAQPRSRMVRLRRQGAALLAVAVALNVWHDGPAFGIVTTVLMFSQMGIAVAFTLALRPHWLRLLTGSESGETSTS